MSDAIEFLPITWRQRKLGAAQHSYRVYKDDGTFVTVEASTAAEAFKLSGVTHALRISKEYHEHSIVIPQGMLVDESGAPSVNGHSQVKTEVKEVVRAPRNTAAPAVASATPPVEMTIPPVAADTSPPASATPQFTNQELTKEEVDKLLGK